TEAQQLPMADHPVLPAGEDGDLCAIGAHIDPKAHVVESRPERLQRAALTSPEMAQPTDIFDIGRLGLSSGEGRRLELQVAVEPFEFGGQQYAVEGRRPPAILDIAHTTTGYSLRLRF